MTFYEKELRKIVEPNYPDATYVGRACYVRLNEMNRAKIQFITMGIAKHYEALRLTILNRQEGDVDNLVLRFNDVLGKKAVNHSSYGRFLPAQCAPDAGLLSVVWCSA